MLRRLSRHPWLAPIVIVGLSLFLSAALCAVTPLPVPQFHDEFSYLLAGETFARGRLTNPAHPLSKFFETFQVLSQPTYMSKYPPLQGMFLALGRAVFDEPIVGVWISGALASAAAWWALVGMVPRRWAFVGALVAALHPLMLRWNWSYWGGAGSMIGGCLLIGAMARVTKSKSAFDGAMLGLGVGILMNARPFEGAVLTVLCFFSARYRSHGRESVVSRSTAVALLVFAAIATWTGYYNHRVTGRATQFPYALYEKQYAVTAPLVWLPAPTRQPAYNHPVMRDFYLRWEWDLYQRHHSVWGLLGALRDKAWNLLRAWFSSPVLVVPVMMSLLCLRRDRRLRRMLIIAAIALAVSFSGLELFPHYTAPLTIVLLYIVIQGLRHLRARVPAGRAIVMTVLWLHVISALWASWALAHPLAEGWQNLRARMQADLSHQGRHLVIVRSENSYVHFDWVYNDPDIDAAPLVWARDMGDQANRELLDYFRDRQCWLLNVTESSAKLDQVR
jgi:hypothetical protein